MKLTRHEPKGRWQTTISRKLAAEQLRARRSENTQRSTLCYGWLGVTAISIFSVLAIVFMAGRGMIVLSDKVLIVLIGATVANAWALLNTIFKGVFSRKE
jgi:hypothetical protein